MNHLLDNLNEDQLKAVTTTDGPLLVIAGAGSGKTRVLTRRLAYILTKQLAKPYQILAMTFSNKAASEMNSRVESLLGGSVQEMNVSTFHSFCARFLRREGHALGYDSDFSIFDAEDSRTLVKNCLKELSLSGSQFTPKGQLRKISSAKNSLIGAEAFHTKANGYFENTTARIYNLYQKRLRQFNAMDFDDLLFNTVRVLHDIDDVGNRYRQRFRYLMVDEYQDTNHVQYVLLKELIGEHANICVVGDEDQSIYGWRGADIRNILDFEKDFPGAQVIKLEQNYRSTKIILQAASSVIENNESRKSKTLWTTSRGGDNIKLIMVDAADEESRSITDEILKLKNDYPLKEMAILYRTNAQSRPFEEHLRRHSLPYQIFGSISFYQRKEIKDLLAYLRLIVNPKDDVSFARVINYPKRGIGEKTIGLIRSLAENEDQSCLDIARRCREFVELSARAGKIEQFALIIDKSRADQDSIPVDVLVEDLIDALNLIDELRSEEEITAQTRIENVEALVEGMALYARKNPQEKLADYLSEISLFVDLDKYDDSEEKVTMMTLHSAKGLEYDAVFMVGLEEGLFPLQRTIFEPSELEEERRLFYVGATRARKKLYLSTATSRHRFGVVESIPSRFIKEIPEEIVDVIDLRQKRHYDYEQQPQPLKPYYRRPSATSTNGNELRYEYEEDEQFRAGRIVQHPSFGRGRIVNSEGFGESLRLEISFSGVGVKKIMVKYARLKVIG